MEDSTPHPVWVTLTEAEMAQARAAALETSAIAGECAERYARPDERRDVGLRIDPDTALVFFVHAQPTRTATAST